MESSRLAALGAFVLIFAVSSARACFGGPPHTTDVSPEGDFQVEMPKGWIVQRHVGNPKGHWYLPFYDGNKGGFLETIFRDPELPEYSLVVQWHQYGDSRSLLDGMSEWIKEPIEIIR